MLNFASITPHPPIIIPTIGKERDLELVKNTILAMEKLREIFEKADSEILLIVSPHSPINFHKPTFLKSENFYGNFLMFGDFSTQLSFEGDLKFLEKIEKEFEKEKIEISFENLSELDHGVLVPLYYLSKNKKPKIVPFSYSMLDPKINFKYGKVLANVIKKDKRKIGFVASGDLSHRLTIDAPAGYSPKGLEFDRKIVEFLEKKDIKSILNMDDDFVEEAGECGLRSIAILLGVLSELKNLNFDFQTLSYEGPFGVGYLVANVEGL